MTTQFKGYTYSDGGVLLNLDAAAAVERCREVVDDEHDIIVDIIMCSGAVIDRVNASNYNSISVIQRVKAIMKYMDNMGFVALAKLNYPQVNFRYIVAPWDKLEKELLPIGFKNSDTLIKRGIRDAYKVVAMGPGNMKDAMLNHFMATKFGKTEETLTMYLENFKPKSDEPLISQ